MPPPDLIESFPWSERFNTGLAQVDEQHRMLLHLLNQLVFDLAVHPYLSEAQLHASVQALVDYTHYHFDTESEIWNQYLPGHALELHHENEHENFRQKIATVVASLREQAQPSVVQRLLLEDVAPFLIRWLAYHILESDRLLAHIVLRLQAGDTIKTATISAEYVVRDNKRFYVDFVVANFLRFSDIAVRLATEMAARQEAQRAVENTQAHLQALTDSTDDLIWSVSTNDFRMQTCNQGLMRYLRQHQPSELTAEDLQEFVSLFREHYLETQNYGAYTLEYEDLSHQRTLLLNFNLIAQVEQFQEITVFGKDITDQKQLMALASHTSLHDVLTDLPNRRLLLDRLHLALLSSKRTGRHGALLLFDLDDFKSINDGIGHDVGDLVLVEVARRIGLIFRGDDTFARMGDDEFCVLLNDLSANKEASVTSVQSIAQKILVAFKTPFLVSGQSLSCTCSIGVSLFLGASEGFKEVMQQAESAMYRAKSDGKDSARFFDPSMQAYLISRLAIETGLRSALPDQLRVFYQLQVNGEGQVVGAEVLLRWQHPTQGFISPELFVPFAEESGIIVPIGYWVLRQVCGQIRRWEQDDLLMLLPISINVSVKQFNQPDFVERVGAILDETGVSGHLLKMELTESLMVDHVDEVCHKMMRLKECGINFSLDDFGTGYSSLSSLSRLPLTQIKIDRAFVRDITVNPTNATIARMITSLCKALHLTVIAEGVEERSQLNLLNDMGCDGYQGFLFSEPVPADRFESIVRHRGVCCALADAAAATAKIQSVE